MNEHNGAHDKPSLIIYDFHVRAFAPRLTDFILKCRYSYVN